MFTVLTLFEFYVYFRLAVFKLQSDKLNAQLNLRWTIIIMGKNKSVFIKTESQKDIQQNMKSDQPVNLSSIATDSGTDRMI